MVCYDHDRRASHNCCNSNLLCVNKEFDENSSEYYPSACCEILHVTNAVYLATILQIIFVITIGVLYHFLERNSFINAVEVFRPAVIFIVCINVVGILCALVGVILQRDLLISAQVALLAGLVIVSDLIALGLIVTMASSGWGAKRQTSGASDARVIFASLYFINERRFESVLGPFWIYLTAILFHMCAAATMCVIGVYRRYGKYLKDKFNYSCVHCGDDLQMQNRSPQFI